MARFLQLKRPHQDSSLVPQGLGRGPTRFCGAMPRAQCGQTTVVQTAAGLLPRDMESFPVLDPVTWSLGSYPKETTKGEK